MFAGLPLRQSDSIPPLTLSCLANETVWISGFSLYSYYFSTYCVVTHHMVLLFNSLHMYIVVVVWCAGPSSSPYTATAAYHAIDIRCTFESLCFAFSLFMFVRVMYTVLLRWSWCLCLCVIVPAVLSACHLLLAIN